MSADIRPIQLSLIDDNPWQTRPVDAAYVRDELAPDLKANGLIQPIVVREHPTKRGRYQSAVGHHRRAALVYLGEQTVLAEVRALTDLQMADLAISENDRRRPLSAIQKAKALQRLLAEFKLTQAEAGQRFGLKDQASVSNLLKLLKLPEGVQAAVAAGELPERLGRQLVAVGRVAPKELERAVKRIVAAPLDERDSEYRSQVSDILRRKGRNLYQAVFDRDWPAEPIAVDKPTDGQPAELRACHGCAFYIRNQGQGYCALPACFDLKQERRVGELLQAASERTGIPLRQPRDKVSGLYGRFDYDFGPSARKLVAEAAQHPELGLRLMAAGEGPHWSRDLFGSEYIALMSTDATATRAFLKAGARANGAGKSTSTKPLTPAQIERQKVAEDEAREERRLERASRQRVEHDTIWLVQTYAQLVGDQLAISGGALAYVVGRLLHSNRQQAANFYGLNDWYDGLAERAKAAGPGKAADQLRRVQLVAAEVFENALPWKGPNDSDCWADVTAALVGMAAAEHGRSRYDKTRLAGFNVRLPAGWDKPPVHKTDYNCWSCGTFAGGAGRQLTKKDLAAGWVVVREGKQVKSVSCQHCAKAAPKKGGRR